MNPLKSIVVLALLCALLLPLTVSAQEDAPPGEKTTEAKPAAEKPKAAELDELSKKLFDGYEKSMYHLGRAGVKKASFTLDAKVTNLASGEVMQGKGKYAWDGEKGSLNWDNEQLGMFLGTRGFSLEQMDGNFKEVSLLDKLTGTKLTGKMNEDGTATVTVEGENPNGYTAFHFGEDGVMSATDLETDVGTGQPTKIKTTMTHGKARGKLIVTGLSIKFEIPGYGEIAVATTLTYEKVGEFTVLTKMLMAQSLAGTPISELSIGLIDWKLNDDEE